ncbi:hypothetical protein D3C80_963540 [compost metagenome]
MSIILFLLLPEILDLLPLKILMHYHIIRKIQVYRKGPKICLRQNLQSTDKEILCRMSFTIP